MADQFHVFANAVHERFKAISSGELYTVDAGDLFETYLAAFPAGTNPLYRERTEHDCSACKNFIRNIGHVVRINGDSIETVWDKLVDVPYPYNIVAFTLDMVVRQLPINGIWRTTERHYGQMRSIEVKEGQTREYRHFHGDVPQRNRPDRPDKARGDAGTAAQVFRRALDEISIESLITVLDLIDSNSLYRGAEKRNVVDEFITAKRAYMAASDRNLFVWSNVHSSVARFRSDVIGTLASDLSAGVPMEDAVRMFESKVAPQNYRRTTALITPRMVDAAVTQLRALGLESAIERRMARISDVSVNDILFVDNAVRGQMRDGIAGLLADSVKAPTPDIKHATPITIDDFIESVVPSASTGGGVNLLVQNKHAGNFVTVTAPVHADDAATKLLQWDNGFSWSYEGDVADSIKQRVKRAGGNVDNAALRVSLSWSNFDDLDIHCVDPSKNHIFYANKSGVLDVDMNVGFGMTRDPVENLSWTRDKLRNGVYRISVVQFYKRENQDVGFTIEIECAGEIQQFSYTPAVSGEIRCFDLHIQDGRIVALHMNHPDLTASNASRSVWSVSTETLVPVNTIMNSPNHWGDSTVGNKHWFFILKGCKNPNPTRGFYNEQLNPALRDHRKVFEVLGTKTKCEPTDDQLSGVGFSSGRGDSVTAVVKGRAYQIQF